VRILSRYFVARFLGLFVTVLVAAVLILATIELVLNLDDLSGFSTPTNVADEAGPSGGLALALRFIALRLSSYYLGDLLPIAAFVAAFATFAWAGRVLEIVAIQASGIRLVRIVAPVLGTAVLLSIVAALLQETVTLEADRRFASRDRADRDQIDFRRSAFWYHKGPSITNIRQADPATRSLYGVEVFERGPDGSVVRVIRSEIVRIEPDGTWRFEEATVWAFDPRSPDARPRFYRGVSVALDLASLGGDTLLAADPALLDLPDLADYLESAEPASPTNRRRLEGRFHDRLSRPPLVLLFTWMALPFALRVDGRGLIARPALAGVVALALFFLARSAGTTLAREGLIATGPTPWLTILAFALASGLGLRRRAL